MSGSEGGRFRRRSEATGEEKSLRARSFCEFMDKHTSIHQLKEKVRKFCEDRNWDRYHNAKDLAIGIITESSELLEHFRFKNKEESEKLLKNPRARRKICEELVDVLHTILRFAQIYDIDLSAELGRKMKKNERKYPLSSVRRARKK